MRLLSSIIIIAFTLIPLFVQRRTSFPFSLYQRITVNSKLQITAREPVQLCSSEHCNQCQAACPPYSILRSEHHRCEQSLPIATAIWPWDAYMHCVKDYCKPYFFQNACGLLPAHNNSNTLLDIDNQIKNTSSLIHSFAQKRERYFDSRVLNDSMRHYHRHALAKIRQSDTLFLKALSVRSRYNNLLNYTQSLAYRIIKQEVIRLRFEKDDFERHLKFWKRQNETLHLVMQTSPTAVKAARNSLYAEMRIFETDALLIKALRDGSYNKEEQLRFTIRLKERVRKELDTLRNQNALVEGEATFIHDAKLELYKLLLHIWNRISKQRASVNCGANVLTDAVTDAFKLENV